jgi:hypothetical protein
MALIQPKYIETLDGSKVVLENNQAFKSKSADGLSEIEIVKVDGNDVVKFSSVPEVSSDASTPDGLVRKSQLDAEVTSLDGEISQVASDLSALEATKGQPGGIAPLNGSGLIAEQYLPSYVDDVLEYANLAAFPVTGEQGKIYVAIDSGKCYRWSGSAYVQITSGAVDSVFGRNGVVTAQSGDYSTNLVPEGGSTNLYYTPARQAAIEAYADQAEADAVAAASALIDQESAALEAEDLTFLKLDGTRPMTGNLLMGQNSIQGANSVTADTFSTQEHTLGLGEATLQATNEITGEFGWIQVTSSKVEIEQGNENPALFKIEGASFSFSGADIAVGTKKITGLADGVNPADAINKGQLEAAAQEAVTIAAAYTDQEVLTEKNRAEAAEAALDGRVDALELASLQFVKEKFVVNAGILAAGYVELQNTAISESISAFVDRLALHFYDGSDGDYTLTTVAGKTRLVFAGSLVNPSPEKLGVGDTIRVTYCKRAII